MGIAAIYTTKGRLTVFMMKITLSAHTTEACGVWDDIAWKYQLSNLQIRHELLIFYFTLIAIQPSL